MRDRMQLQRAPRIALFILSAHSIGEQRRARYQMNIAIIIYTPSIFSCDSVTRAVASLMDMRLDLFVLLSRMSSIWLQMCALGIYLLFRRHRSGWCRVFNIKHTHAESDVDSYERCCAPRWMCTQLYGRKRLRRNWVICQWSARFSSRK